MSDWRTDERKRRVASADQAEAARLVFQWVKTGQLNVREFMELYPLIDAAVDCDKCGGSRGGVPGNEQLCGIMWLCDECAADWMRDNERRAKKRVRDVH